MIDLLHLDTCWHIFLEDALLGEMFSHTVFKDRLSFSNIDVKEIKHSFDLFSCVMT